MKIPLSWRRIRHRYRLVATKCETCGRVFFPPRVMCTECRRRGKLTEIELSGRGKIFSYSVVHVPPKEHELLAPYIIAIIQLEEGPRVLAQVVDCEPDEVRIGMPVELAFRRITEESEGGLIHYGYKFRPVISAQKGD